jgi:hypothetical protein
VEGVLVCVHVQRVNIEVVPRHAQALKHLLQRQPLAVPAATYSMNAAYVTSLALLFGWVKQCIYAGRLHLLTKVGYVRAG